MGKHIRKQSGKYPHWLWRIGVWAYGVYSDIRYGGISRRLDRSTNNDKVIYLTFDDGPGEYTPQLLAVLEKYHVKATFFVVNTPYADYITQIAAAGHAIGIHTMSHDFQTIYSSEEAYYEDLGQIDDLIYEKAGIRTKLLRFPGGSANASSSFNKGIMTKLTSSVQERGYRYFDWHIDSRDALGVNSPIEIFRNILAGLRPRTQAVVLQHESNEFSMAVVRSVILWGRRHGYTFRSLDMDSPEVHQTLKN